MQQTCYCDHRVFGKSFSWTTSLSHRKLRKAKVMWGMILTISCNVRRDAPVNGIPSGTLQVKHEENNRIWRECDNHKHISKRCKSTLCRYVRSWLFTVCFGFLQLEWWQGGGVGIRIHLEGFKAEDFFGITLVNHTDSDKWSWGIEVFLTVNFNS